MRNKITIGEYLAFLSEKHKVDSEKFYNAFKTALENKKSRCGKLEITCRQKRSDSAVFLITKNQQVIAQFPIPFQFLREKTNPIRSYKDNFFYDY